MSTKGQGRRWCWQQTCLAWQLRPGIAPHIEPLWMYMLCQYKTLYLSWNSNSWNHPSLTATWYVHLLKNPTHATFLHHMHTQGNLLALYANSAFFSIEAQNIWLVITGVKVHCYKKHRRWNISLWTTWSPVGNAKWRTPVDANTILDRAPRNTFHAAVKQWQDRLKWWLNPTCCSLHRLG